MTKLVILDRDGVINEDRDDFLNRWMSGWPCLAAWMRLHS